jgi:hypothetical protein
VSWGAHSSDDVRFDAAAICCAAVFHAAGTGRVFLQRSCARCDWKGDRACDRKERREAGKQDLFRARFDQIIDRLAALGGVPIARRVLLGAFALIMLDALT